MRSKKLTPLFLVLAFNLFIVSTIQAKETMMPNPNYRDTVNSAREVTTPLPKMTPVKELRQGIKPTFAQERTILKTTIAAEKDAVKSELIPQLVMLLNNNLSNALNRLTSRANLLEEISVKIDERLTTIEAEKGVTLTEARSFLTQAKTELAKSRTLISAISIDTSSITTKDQLEVERKSLKSQVETAYQSLKKVSELLRKSVQSAMAKNLSITPKPRPSITGKVRPITSPMLKRIPLPTAGTNLENQ